MNRALMLQVEKNFEEFLNYVRINRAAELLLTGALRAYETGSVVRLD